ncbi:MAG: hypothetical protein QOI66_3039 [Myxococcales bacterium]|nr:hypothetical protein [Myxococcales bacterium]
MTTAAPPPKSARIRLTRRSSAYWRVTIDNPPINVMSPEMIGQFHELINALETDDDLRVVVFDSAVDDYFLNHSDSQQISMTSPHYRPVRLACRNGQIFSCV